ncbi:hypothetical protein DL93DRAFT_2075439 [Clavulina sp. PMI_390]|nr:hypothetical protein DL93DRAFT_2075439 [Clavulina sp. PMI_390]
MKKTLIHPTIIRLISLRTPRSFITSMRLLSACPLPQAKLWVPHSSAHNMFISINHPLLTPTRTQLRVAHHRHFQPHSHDHEHHRLWYNATTQLTSTPPTLL